MSRTGSYLAGGKGIGGQSAMTDSIPSNLVAELRAGVGEAYSIAELELRMLSAAVQIEALTRENLARRDTALARDREIERLQARKQELSRRLRSAHAHIQQEYERPPCNCDVCTGAADETGCEHKTVMRTGNLWKCQDCGLEKTLTTVR